MNDDVAASRTTPSDKNQQKPVTTDRRLSDSHFQGFGRMFSCLLVNPSPYQTFELCSQSGVKANILADGHHGKGLFSKEGKIGKHFATEETTGEHAGNKEEPKSKQRVDRSEMYGGYGA